MTNNSILVTSTLSHWQLTVRNWFMHSSQNTVTVYLQDYNPIRPLRSSGGGLLAVPRIRSWSDESKPSYSPRHMLHYGVCVCVRVYMTAWIPINIYIFKVLESG